MRGYIMAGVGFVMILLSAFSYIFQWGFGNPAFSALGLVFVLIGMKIARRPGGNMS